MSIVSDGFHSLTDSASNVVALVGVSVARRPPDANHPYGHRKYETMASIGILVFLIIVLVEVLSAATDRFLNGGTPRVFPEGIAIMAITLAINVFVVSYELAAARRLRSEVLRADAKHTRSDVLTSGAVLGALVGVWLGYPILDPLAALLVAAFIGHACWEIAQEASRILGDEIVIAEGEVREVLRTVPEVLGCEKIRTRGSADYVFLDLHLWLAPDTPLQAAHAQVARSEGPLDGAISPTGRRRHPHRAAAASTPSGCRSACSDHRFGGMWRRTSANDANTSAMVTAHEEK